MEKKADELYQSGKKQQAVVYLAKKLQSDNTHSDWFLQLSSYLLAGGDIEQAEELLLRAKPIFPDNQEIDYNLAVLYFEAGKNELSQKFLDKITNPDLSSDVYYLMAQQSMKNDQINQALVYAITATDKNPNLPDNQILTGDLLLQLKEFKQSEKYYKKAAELDPTAKIYFKLAIVQLANGNEDFRSNFDKSKKLDNQYFSKHQKELKDIERYIQAQEGDS